MAQTISKDTPLSEITLRRYEKPSAYTKRELTRKICLSIGLLQPGDSKKSTNSGVSHRAHRVHRG